ncbi:MAG: AMP-polyphosphate phosphotransferase [Sphingomonadales bacterium]|nr:AMP-polyphosphate phosphotransferase [Sphingomonadales bacterium]
MTAGTTHLHGLSPGELDAELDLLREQLAELQLPQIAHGRRAIILFEGPEGAGKKPVLRELAAAFDPCHFAVHPVPFDRREAAEGHWLARFWRQLPSAGNTAIFFHSWYRRVLDDRILGRTAEAAVARAFDEINEFEAQQRDYGTLIVKLYFDVSPEVQERRLQERAASQRARGGQRDEPVRVRDDAYGRAVRELRAHTDTRWSPWRMIDGDDQRMAAVTALSAIADAWAQAIPAEAPRLVGEPTAAA